MTTVRKNENKDAIRLENSETAMVLCEAAYELSKKRRRQAKLRAQARDITTAISHQVSSQSITSTSELCDLMGQQRTLLNASLCPVYDGVLKRREANARERLRVKNLNSGFAKLRCILPTVPPNRKPSKVDTLQGAIDYIHRLERLLEETGGVPNISSLTQTSHSHSRQSVTECPFLPERNDANDAITERCSRYPKRQLSHSDNSSSPQFNQLADHHQEHVVYVTQLPSSYVFSDGRIDPNSLYPTREHFRNYMYPKDRAFQLSHSPEVSERHSSSTVVSHDLDSSEIDANGTSPVSKPNSWNFVNATEIRCVY